MPTEGPGAGQPRPRSTCVTRRQARSPSVHLWLTDVDRAGGELTQVDRADQTANRAPGGENQAWAGRRERREGSALKCVTRSGATEDTPRRRFAAAWVYL